MNKDIEQISEKKSKLEEAREYFKETMANFSHPTNVSCQIYKLREKYEQAIEEINQSLDKG